MIFGADTPDVLESKINNLEEQITDAEETVKNTKEELRWSMYLVSYWLLTVLKFLFEICK